MLKKRQRLTTAAFNEVFAVGRRFHTPHFQLIYLTSDDFHAAAVVGKKVHKTAVGRNRLRRQLYGAVYRFLEKQPVPFIVLIVAKPAITQLPQAAIAPALTDALASLTSR